MEKEETKKENNLLDSFEELLKNEKIISFLTLRNYIKKYDANKFLKELENCLKDKELYFLRHCNAQHNAWKSMQPKGSNKDDMPKELRDSNLTKVGIGQCSTLTSSMNKHQFDLVFCSALRRAIQTCYLSFSKNEQIIITSLLREKTKRISDLGSKVEILKELYGKKESINFDFLIKSQWWNYFEEENEETYDIIEKENDVNVYLRVILMMIWFALRPEKKVLFVSHCNIYKSIYFKIDKTKKSTHGKIYQISINDVMKKLNSFFKDFII